MIREVATKALACNLFSNAKPFNLTISVTGRCNSRCKTCNIWKNKTADLSVAHWKKILKSVGDTPMWITISGGEPFIREDFVDIVKLIVVYNKPKFITIATNGIKTDKIENDVRKILKFFKGKLIVNISIDGVGQDHDKLRGIKCHKNLIRTIKQLKQTDITIGLHTVFSKFNIHNYKEIHSFVKTLHPDSFICQIAENRVELSNIGEEIKPNLPEYIKAVKYIRDNPIAHNNVSKIIRSLRERYYKLSIRSMKNGVAPVRCRAGTASAHINYNGDLWACCVKCENMGNLVEQRFDDIWKGKKARAIRKRIKDEKCFCTMANACYSNIMCDPLCAFL